MAKPKPPENETPEQRFKRVAEARTKSILHNLDVLGNCSNKRLYKYEQSDVEKIFSAIHEKLQEVELRYKVKSQNDFSL